jgi:predicted transcriptional regulator
MPFGKFLETQEMLKRADPAPSVELLSYLSPQPVLLTDLLPRTRLDHDEALQALDRLERAGLVQRVSNGNAVVLTEQGALLKQK